MSFDKAKPAASTGLKASNPQILANWAAIEAALDAEHAFATSGTQDGLHTQGSARCFFQDTAPATRIDGDAFTSADLGSLWIDSNSSPDNMFNFLSATTPTWTPISTEIIAVLVAAAHTWAAAQQFSVATTHLGQIISSLATGTAPLSIASTTKVSNLNVDQVDGYDIAAYAGAESYTFPGGRIEKTGTDTSTTDNSQNFSFGTAFPNACVCVVVARADVNGKNVLPVTAFNTTLFTINRHSDVEGSVNFNWIAIGY